MSTEAIDPDYNQLMVNMVADSIQYVDSLQLPLTHMQKADFYRSLTKQLTSHHQPLIQQLLEIESNYRKLDAQLKFLNSWVNANWSLNSNN